MFLVLPREGPPGGPPEARVRGGPGGLPPGKIYFNKLQESDVTGDFQNSAGRLSELDRTAGTDRNIYGIILCT